MHDPSLEPVPCSSDGFLSLNFFWARWGWIPTGLTHQTNLDAEERSPHPGIRFLPRRPSEAVGGYGPSAMAPLAIRLNGLLWSRHRDIMAQVGIIYQTRK